MKHDQRLFIRITEAQRQALERAAARDDRSLSDFVRVTLRRALS
jgi:uncharacterized protein (DUF1778 family)